MTLMTPPPEDGGRIVDEPLSEALSRRYLAYALSTISSRALPDVRDGLKPVHRRLLYAMHRMRLNPEGSAKKCAKVVGEVMGSFHPHGDQSIYDALVRLAQDFAQRYPLIDGQGNFGNIDGDNPAAMRYTECRLTAAAALLMDGIDEAVVDFRPTYDGEEEEPVVVPAGFPNLLANGAAGIAVGMATSIPPHNAMELIDACLAILDDRQISTEALMAHVPGPDFPTGGIIVERAAAIQEAYETGRGSIRVRARYAVEDLGRGMWQVVVTEIPYQVQKGKLIEDLAGLIEAKKAPLLADVRDESAEDLRIVLEPKSRTVEPEHLMESLFRLSALENRFSVNMNVLDASGAPRVMGLKACLTAFLDHRREVLVRRAQYRLEKIERRLHLLDGLLIAFLNLDEVIRIVREAEHPKAELIARFGLTEMQADYILDTRLRNLARLEEMSLKREHGELMEERAGIAELLDSERKQWKLVGTGLKDVRKQLAAGDAGQAERPSGVTGRSSFGEAAETAGAAPVEAFIVREAITVVLSERGWIRAAKGKVEDPSELKFKEGDRLAWLVPAETTDKLLIFASDGRAFTLGCDKLPSGRGHGEPLRLMLDLEEGAELVAVMAHQPGRKLVMASEAGYGFILPEDEALSARRAGKQVMNGVARVCTPADGDHVAVLGKAGKVLVFPLDELPEMPRGKGVKLTSDKKGMADLAVFSAETGPTWPETGGRTRQWPDWRDWLGKRAQAGKVAPRGMKRLRA
ncbi:MAG TPA: DNA topoisomerase IV subunit A [Brevundimonas sp.]|jgi:topoisomerase-4 subunit A|uniref:DNA topoisomerase IV subunit A n=1 Tax=Brevundimonas sp. TaxID=1871086 RepID=UPI002CAB7946|nr:DNA topoisomerase IV subunit A [Brevundimonas sp.]HRH19490.1 DNA topoisomerase IV subunit A [Brevundimonas sp.]